MKSILILALLLACNTTLAKKLVCEKTEVGGGKRLTETKTDEISAQGAFISFLSRLDSNIKLDGYYDAKNKMIGAHINDYENKTSSGSYADLSKEKPFAKVNYRKQTQTGLYLFVLECLEK
ncbi:MAG: hypothetical protein IPM57_07255 [Oligoflexia bacterium]|nr:hypothetical protein [Oligoflexia bacterium]